MEEEKKTPKKGLGIVALIVAFISGLLIIFLAPSLTVATIMTIAALILAIVAVVLGFMGLKGNKVVSIIALIIGFLNLALAGLALIGVLAMGKVTDCVESESNKGFYTCTLMGQKIENVPEGFIKDSQKRK